LRRVSGRCCGLASVPANSLQSMEIVALVQSRVKTGEG
jgi:hypothetical protein